MSPNQFLLYTKTTTIPNVQQVRKDPTTVRKDRNLEYLGIENKLFALYDATHFWIPRILSIRCKARNISKEKYEPCLFFKPRKGLCNRWQAFVQRFLMFLYFRSEKIPYRLFESAVNILYKLS